MDALTIINNFNHLKGQRAALNAELEQCAALCQPAKYGGSYHVRSSSQQGAESRPVEVVSDFGQMASTTFVRGFFSNLFPPSVRWFCYSAGTPDGRHVPDAVRRFFLSASQTVYDILYATNFPVEMNEVCEDASHAGTMPMSVVFDPERLLRFKAHYISNVYCQQSKGDQIDTVYEELQLSAAQIANRFDRPGDKLGEKLSHDAASDRVSDTDKTYTLIHFVAPNRNRKFAAVKRGGATVSEPVPGPEGKAFVSIYVEVEEKVVIRTEGFDYNPYTVARIDNCVTGQVYGVSPALRALRTMKLLNKVWAAYISATDGALHPSVMADLAAYTDLLPEFFFDPGSVNLYNSQGGKFQPPQMYVPPVNLPGGLDFVDRCRKIIDHFFCADLFTLIQQLNNEAGRQRTAREISELVTERNSQILTLVSRFLDELVSPLLKKVFFILYNETNVFGEIDPLVDEFVRSNLLSLQYFSPMAMAARATRIQGTVAAIEDLAPMLQLIPNALDVLKGDELARDMFDVRGADPRHIRDDAELAKYREEVQKQQQQQMMMEQAAELAKSQNLNEAPASGSFAETLVSGGR